MTQERHKRYREKHKDKVHAANTKWYQENKSNAAYRKRKRANYKAWYERNKKRLGEQRKQKRQATIGDYANVPIAVLAMTPIELRRSRHPAHQ